MPLCDTVLRLAERELFRLLLSDDVLDEATRNLVADGRCTIENADRRRRNIKSAFDDCFVSDYHELIDAMACGAKDRHVLAAAVVGGADQIVTINVKDFPKASTDPYGMEVVSPDTFLQNVLDLYHSRQSRRSSIKLPASVAQRILFTTFLLHYRARYQTLRNVMTTFAAQHGGFGKQGAAAAAELGLSALTKALRHGVRGELRERLLFVDDGVVLAFARNSGLGRLQAVVERLDHVLIDGRQGIAVLGALLPEPDVEALAERGVGTAWVTRWNPEIEFDGSPLAHRMAPWLF